MSKVKAVPGIRIDGVVGADLFAGLDRERDPRCNHGVEGIVNIWTEINKAEE